MVPVIANNVPSGAETKPVICIDVSVRSRVNECSESMRYRYPRFPVPTINLPRGSNARAYAKSVASLHTLRAYPSV